MKKNKKLTILLLAAILVVVSVAGYTTYARYQSVGKGTGTVTVAKWAVKVNDTDITTPGDTTIENAGLTWSGLNGLVVENYIAPGMTGASSLKIDPTGSQVPMNYWIKVEMPAFANDNITIKSVTINGTCSVGEGTHKTKAACLEATGVWTPGAALVAAEDGAHVGEYQGTIGLHEGNTTMTVDEIVYAEVEVEWHDYNTDLENADDTATGTAATGIAQNLSLTVTVEQKVE